MPSLLNWSLRREAIFLSGIPLLVMRRTLLDNMVNASSPELVSSTGSDLSSLEKQHFL
jgi:hypothetical protein